MNLTNRNEYWFRLFVAGSLMLAAIFGARMYESGCAAAWRLRGRAGIKGLWARTTVSLMDLLEKGHCRKSSRAHRKLMGGLISETNARNDSKGISCDC